MLCFYRGYRGRTLGRVLYGLEIYLDQRGIVDYCQVGDGEVIYNRKTFATYTWLGETDIPVFKFIGGQAEASEWNQRVRQPFFDDHNTLINAEWMIQEFAKILYDGRTITEAEQDEILSHWHLGPKDSEVFDKSVTHLLECARAKAEHWKMREAERKAKYTNV